MPKQCINDGRGNKSTTEISQHDYSYDGLGNRQIGHVGQAEKVGPTDPGRTYQYVYDQLSRLTAVNSANGISGTPQNPSFTPLATYSYDILNNRTSKTEADGSGVMGPTLYYNHDIVNQLKEIRSGSPSGTLLASLQYDDSGNMTSRVDGTGTGGGTNTTTTLAYNSLNQLSQAGKTGLPTESYGYDDSGRRVRKTLGTTSGPSSSYFMYQGDNISAEYTDNTGGWSSASAAYTQGAGTDQPFLRTEWPSAGAGTNPSSRQFYHQDGLGSVIASTDQSGANAASQRFDAWGNSIASSGTAISQYGYTGREPDATGLMYYRARYYSPDLGRFTQRDPIGLAGGVNMFGYVDGNPVNFTDPSGFAEMCTAASTFGSASSSLPPASAVTVALVAGGSLLPSAANVDANGCILTDGGPSICIGPGAIRAIAALGPSLMKQAIDGIKALPDGAKLTADQISMLGKNIDLLLEKSLPASASSGNQSQLIGTILNDARFRFVDQVPGAVEKIRNALAPYFSFLP